MTYAKEDLLKGHGGVPPRIKGFAEQTESQRQNRDSSKDLRVGPSRSTYAQRLRPRKALEASDLLSAQFQHPTGKQSFSFVLIKITPVDAGLS